MKIHKLLIIRSRLTMAEFQCGYAIVGHETTAY